MKIVKNILISLIRGYQRFISPLFPNTCRFYPSCSNYTLQALQTHSLIYALFLSIKRILKCNPLFKGGIDEVPLKKGHQHG
ncbi:MAG: membrane protein insertion efficiency factor YidD [Candidatus Marinimicrobia bacterium]|nr:membrane protein insertion efficiency factor YidD [Candidatus Neomarinimicrobiota bacterium]